MRVAAVGGWAIPTKWFAKVIGESFPGAEVTVLTPVNPADSEEAKDLLQNLQADLYIGYSLGSLWLLVHRYFIPHKARKILLAPVLGFLREQDRGGKTPETKLKYLMRMLARNPEERSPLLEFHAECGVSFSESELMFIPDPNVLLNGLEFLRSTAVSAEDATGFYAYLGDADPFLDAACMKRLIPGLEILSGAGHSPEPLIRKLAEQIHCSDHKTL